jgi:hypothetical protein
MVAVKVFRVDLSDCRACGARKARSVEPDQAACDMNREQELALRALRNAGHPETAGRGQFQGRQALTHLCHKTVTSAKKGALFVSCTAQCLKAFTFGNLGITGR